MFHPICTLYFPSFSSVLFNLCKRQRQQTNLSLYTNTLSISKNSLYTDINECELLADACHRDSYCSNYYSYHECMCVSGYSGNGTICTGTLKDLQGIYKVRTVFVTAKCWSKGVFAGRFVSPKYLFNCKKILGVGITNHLKGYRHQNTITTSPANIVEFSSYWWPIAGLALILWLVMEE